MKGVSVGVFWSAASPSRRAVAAGCWPDSHIDARTTSNLDDLPSIAALHFDRRRPAGHGQPPCHSRRLYSRRSADTSSRFGIQLRSTTRMNRRGALLRPLIATAGALLVIRSPPCRLAHEKRSGAVVNEGMRQARRFFTATPRRHGRVDHDMPPEGHEGRPSPKCRSEGRFAKDGHRSTEFGAERIITTGAEECRRRLRGCFSILLLA